MKNNFFSIIIPTRQRHDTLGFSIRTVLNQEYKNLELIIIDNNSTKETKEVTSSFKDERIKYYRSSSSLAMSENWELGLEKAKGDYINILGDDDGLTHDALKKANEIIKKTQTPIVSWMRWPYYWPSFNYSQNILIVPLSKVLYQTSSYSFAKELFSFKKTYETSPSLYNSFVARQIVERAKEKNKGHYFHEHCANPDVYSGISNTLLCDHFIYYEGSLSCSGISKHSNLSIVSDVKTSNEAQWNLEEKNKLLHPMLGQVPSELRLYFHTLSDYLWAKEQHCKTKIEFDFCGATQYLLNQAASHNAHFENYMLAAKYLVENSFFKETEILNIPKYIPTKRISKSMWLNSAKNLIAVDCKIFDAENIHDAILIHDLITKNKIDIISENEEPVIHKEDVERVKNKLANQKSLNKMI